MLVLSYNCFVNIRLISATTASFFLALMIKKKHTKHAYKIIILLDYTTTTEEEEEGDWTCWDKETPCIDWRLEKLIWSGNVMIDLLICCLVLLPFLREDIQLCSGDRGAQASEGHWGPSPYQVTTRTCMQKRDRLLRVPSYSASRWSI